MGKIIDLQEKKRREQIAQTKQARSRRMESILQMFRCARCAMKCMKCGSQMDSSPRADRSPAVPYRLCGGCLEEYQEFLDRLHERGDPEDYWYNREWVDVWKAWMHYQDALQRYELSDGFRRLLQELRER